MSGRPDLYDELARELPNEVRLGGAHITLVEPTPGMERDYNRWYEDDHFYAGAMAGPWKFAGRRFVATRALRELRAVRPSAIAPDDDGCYLALYWVTAGHEDDAQRWALTTMNEALAPAGRALNVDGEMRGRRHVYTAWHLVRFSVVRDGLPMRVELALDHPFPGVVLEVVEATGDVGALETWLESAIARRVPGTPVALAAGFQAFPYPEADRPAIARQPDAADRRIAVVWFLDEDPGDCYPAVLAEHHAELEASGLGTLVLSAPFIPTVPGTDRYVDQLR